MNIDDRPFQEQIEAGYGIFPPRPWPTERPDYEHPFYDHELGCIRHGNGSVTNWRADGVQCDKNWNPLPAERAGA